MKRIVAKLAACAGAMILLCETVPVASAAEVPRTGYVIGSVAPMPDADLIIATLTARLTDVGLHPSLRQQGTELTVEVDTAEPDLVAALLTQRGALVLRGGGQRVESCDGLKLKGLVCLPATGAGSPFMLVGDKILMSGDIIASAEPTGDEGQRGVAIALTGAAAAEFADLTAGMTGDMLSIVIDDEVVMAAVIREPIVGGKVVIAGNSIDADGLATLLARPALPHALQIFEIYEATPRQGARSHRGRKR